MFEEYFRGLKLAAPSARTFHLRIFLFFDMIQEPLTPAEYADGCDFFRTSRCCSACQQRVLTQKRCTSALASARLFDRMQPHSAASSSTSMLLSGCCSSGSKGGTVGSLCCSGMERMRKEANSATEWDTSSLGSNASMESAGTGAPRFKNEQAAIAAAEVMKLHREEVRAQPGLPCAPIGTRAPV